MAVKHTEEMGSLVRHNTMAITFREVAADGCLRFLEDTHGFNIRFRLLILAS